LRIASCSCTASAQRGGVIGARRHNLKQEQPAAEATQVAFQDALVARLQEITGVRLP
jgi:hypothetical protein